MRPLRHQPTTVVTPVVVSHGRGRVFPLVLAVAALAALAVGGVAWRSGRLDPFEVAADQPATTAPPPPQPETHRTAIPPEPPLGPGPRPTLATPALAAEPLAEPPAPETGPRPAPATAIPLAARRAPEAARPPPRVATAPAGARPLRAAAPPVQATPPPAPPPSPAAFPEPTPAAAPPAPPTSAATALAPALVQRAVAAQKAGFDHCVDAALSAPGGFTLAGRKVGLLLAVVGGGQVEAVQVEEPDVEGSALGACLRRTAGRLRFPPFGGEPVGIRVPLQLGAAVASPGER